MQVVLVLGAALLFVAVHGRRDSEETAASLEAGEMLDLLLNRKYGSSGSGSGAEATATGASAQATQKQAGQGPWDEDAPSGGSSGGSDGNAATGGGNQQPAQQPAQPVGAVEAGLQGLKLEGEPDSCTEAEQSHSRWYTFGTKTLHQQTINTLFDMCKNHKKLREKVVKLKTKMESAQKALQEQTDKLKAALTQAELEFKQGASELQLNEKSIAETGQTLKESNDALKK